MNASSRCFQYLALCSAMFFWTASNAVHAQTAEITLDSVLVALHAGDSAIDFAAIDPARHHALDSLTLLLRELRATDLGISDFAAAASAEPPGFLRIFRWDRDKAGRSAQPALRSALLRLQQIVMPQPNGLGPRILASLHQSGYQEYVGAMELLQTQAILVVQAASTDKLRRYELKFGPGAARLNPVETSLNWLLERVPGIGFGPNSRGPGPLEFVAAYTNTDLTTEGSATSVRLVSAANLGFRFYTFDTTSTRGTIGRFLHPGTVSLGMSSFSPTDRPLDSPLRTGRRLGAFVDWGSMRVSAALGHDWRALIGTGAQLIPHLF
jgi:hypothetical protein